MAAGPDPAWSQDNGGRAAHWPTAATQVVGVIGTPIRHSLSPAIHNAAFASLGMDWAFVAFEVAAGDARTALVGARALGVTGLSVTMPHKAEVAAAVDEVSGVAAALGAVNTVVRRGARLIGDSTDGEGFLASLRAVDVDPAGRRAVVIGAGGAARAVVLALGSAGGEVVVVARRPEAAREAALLAGPTGRVGGWADIGAAELVVNATPVGMAGTPGEGRLAVDPGSFHPGQVVVDLVYHPRRTPLLVAAEAAGAQAVDGVGMLVHQAALAFRLWTGVDAPLAVMRAAALEALAG